MPRIRDVKIKQSEANFAFTFSGVKNQIHQEYLARCRAIGDAIMRERHINAEQARALDPDRELWEQSAPLFIDLCRWLDEHVFGQAANQR